MKGTKAKHLDGAGAVDCNGSTRELLKLSDWPDRAGGRACSGIWWRCGGPAKHAEELRPHIQRSGQAGIGVSKSVPAMWLRHANKMEMETMDTRGE